MNKLFQILILNDHFIQISTIAIQTHVSMEHVWMETIHTLVLVWMATRGLFVMASIADISVPSGDVLIKKTFV